MRRAWPVNRRRPHGVFEWDPALDLAVQRDEQGARLAVNHRQPAHVGAIPHGDVLSLSGEFMAPPVPPGLQGLTTAKWFNYSHVIYFLNQLTTTCAICSVCFIANSLVIARYGLMS